MLIGEFSRVNVLCMLFWLVVILWLTAMLNHRQLLLPPAKAPNSNAQKYYNRNKSAQAIAALAPDESSACGLEPGPPLVSDAALPCVRVCFGVTVDFGMLDAWPGCPAADLSYFNKLAVGSRGADVGVKWTDVWKTKTLRSLATIQRTFQSSSLLQSPDYRKQLSCRMDLKSNTYGNQQKPEILTL